MEVLSKLLFNVAELSLLYLFEVKNKLNDRTKTVFFWVENLKARDSVKMYI